MMIVLWITLERPGSSVLSIQLMSLRVDHAIGNCIVNGIVLVCLLFLVMNCLLFQFIMFLFLLVLHRYFERFGNDDS